jgi:uncharacterized protein
MLSQEQEALCAASEPRFEALRAQVRGLSSALVAFSGGVDSTLVLKVAVEELGSRAVALTAVSASLAPEEETSTRALAESFGVRHLLVRSQEIANPAYVANSTQRCYFCKSELYALCAEHRSVQGLDAVLDGFNAEDKRDHRPGQQAAREQQVFSPLAEHGFNKAEVRAWSHKLGLPNWDKPAMPCLASRIPYGTSVTVERLWQIGSAESALRALGLRVFRVRYHGEVARLEVSAEELPMLLGSELRSKVNAELKARGFKFVAIDLEQFRSGRLNEAAGVAPAQAPAL